jgi:hypothetical protein
MGRPRKWVPKPCRRCRRTIPRWRRSDADFCSQKCSDAFHNGLKRQKREEAQDGHDPSGRVIEAVRTYAPGNGRSEAQTRDEGSNRKDLRDRRIRPSLRPEQARSILSTTTDPDLRRRLEEAFAAKERRLAKHGRAQP